MSNFFPLFFLYFIQLHFPRSFQRTIFFSLVRSLVLSLFQCKQVCAVWILYNLSDLLRNTICTYGILFCRVEFARAVCVYAAAAATAVSVSIFFFPSQFNEILNFRTNRSGRGTRNWRMLMNKNAWKKESALWHINRHRINIETLMCRWLMTFCFGVFACARKFFFSSCRVVLVGSLLRSPCLSRCSIASIERAPENKEFHS